MSTFVHPENQKIIWSIVNSNPYVTEYFVTNKNTSKETWFRNIIEKFYSQNQGRSLSVPELNQLNKDTLSFMIQSIHNTAPNFQTTPIPPITNDINPIRKTEILTPPLIENTRQEQSISDFNARQQEYDNMTKKNVPDEIDFKEGNKDEAIQDMDYLIKQHMKEREDQLQLTPPPNIMPDTTTKEEPVITMPAAVTMPTNATSNDHYDIEIKTINDNIAEMKEMLKKNNELLSMIINNDQPITNSVLQQTDEPGNIQTTIIEKETVEENVDISMNLQEGNQDN